MYGCIKHNTNLRAMFARLEDEAIRNHLEISDGSTTRVRQPLTNKATILPRGRYLFINDKYHGLDHSGDGADGESDELWASLFEEYHGDRELPAGLGTAMSNIVNTLNSMPKPLNPCDPDQAV